MTFPMRTLQALATPSSYLCFCLILPLLSPTQPSLPGILGSENMEDQTSMRCKEKCPQGEMCKDEATIETLPCPLASFCPEGTSVPLACPGGRYSNSTSLSSSEQCHICADGFYAPTQSAAPIVCAPGSYTSEATPHDKCTSCAAGTFQEAEGGTACDRCTPGYYCKEGAAAPLPCPAGTRTNASLDVMKSQDDCITCGEGSFCPVGSANATACAAGTYNELAGQGKCLKCAAGTFQVPFSAHSNPVRTSPAPALILPLPCTTPHHKTPHDTTRNHTKSHHTTPHHTTPHHTTRHHTTPHHATPHHTTPHHTTPHHTTPHHTTPRRATPRHATPRHTTPHHVAPRHATLLPGGGGRNRMRTVQPRRLLHRGSERGAAVRSRHARRRD